jgi:hypothetical protein
MGGVNELNEEDSATSNGNVLVHLNLLGEQIMMQMASISSIEGVIANALAASLTAIESARDAAIQRIEQTVPNQTTSFWDDPRHQGYSSDRQVT